MTFQKDDLLTVTVIFVLKWQNPTYIPNFSVVVRVINLVRQCQYLTWKSPRSALTGTPSILEKYVWNL